MEKSLENCMDEMRTSFSNTKTEARFERWYIKLEFVEPTFEGCLWLEIYRTEAAGVTGCVLSNNQGLCLGVKGKASNESSGVITAIANQVARLEPGSKPPIILLENDNRQCIVMQKGAITAAIYKINQAT